MRVSFGQVIVGLAGVIGLLFLLLPVAVLAIEGVRAQGWLNAPASGVPQAITLSVATTFVTSALTILFGTPLAYLLARWRFPFKRLINLLIELPIVLPPAVAGLALLETFGRRGAFGPALETVGVNLPFTTAAVVLAQTFVSAPFFIRSAQVGFQNVARHIEDAARVDGAAGWVLFRHITLPLASRALVAGLVLSWARALGEFGATILFAGSLQGRTQTMPLLIYNVLERDLDAAIWTGLLLIIMAVIALAVASWLRQTDEPAE
ncbi:MAG: molybdate ABC transporter permease subunit [Chloroflexi bacterium]|nr:molybdate ABC transporter permease subunit [Chloroflexota bacterium]